MIRPAPGVAFTWAADGDQRADASARATVSAALGVPSAWATVSQVHGGAVVSASVAGVAGDADAVVVTGPGLPAAVFTADCLGVVLRGNGVVGVAHAGWRGLDAGVVESTIEAMVRTGSDPQRAYVGPGIGPCCFEVGGDVADRFPRSRARTSWGTVSVDLAGEVERRLDDLPVWIDPRCTRCGGGFSHRRTGGPERMAAIGWVVGPDGEM